jgi:hypothetical protein
LEDDGVLPGLPGSFAPWLSKVQSEIRRLGDPAAVLAEIHEIEQRYHRITQKFSFGRMLEDAERIVGPIDVPPYDDSRLSAALSEVRILVQQTLAAMKREPKPE